MYTKVSLSKGIQRLTSNSFSIPLIKQQSISSSLSQIQKKINRITYFCTHPLIKFVLSL
ncbi:unnamed protein product (macronuclear) [Paramecium tetraurelia]|uniref:Uncharacterized protein n=1 Tax=Paramecium tetraurelia TaxID=5888 RepID=A0E793_PARTE|nr:uncharacterized protein GSPATT00023888001 [Paramecium tetraurelia]CAK91160.1 unnamed protein product [Paramecium tetraurelia]|eukprot:XP_001458557.1 hypothetical protein (macronuclear) [Paramecium tetraurelia strain d4-2]